VLDVLEEASTSAAGDTTAYERHLMQTRPAQQPVADLLIRRKLKAAGVMPTRQRIDLAHAIFGSGARHFTAETLYQETRAVHFAPTRGTIYNTLNEFARCGLLREIALYDAKVWYDTKTGPHFHFYLEDTDELSDIPDCELPEIEIPSPEGMRVAAIDVIVRVKKA
jgi:Fur family iron response transcriptional regulator